MIKERKEQKERKKRILRLVILTIVILAITYFFLNSRHTKTPVKIQTAAIQTNEDSFSPTPTIVQVFQNSPGLTNIVQNALVGTHGTYGIVIKNLTTKEIYFFNQNNVFNSASLYKLWVMAEIFQEVQNGKLKLTDTLRADVVTLNKKFGLQPDPNGQTSGIITLSIQDALYQMITISDNNAALLLTSKVSVPSLVSFLQKNGFTDSKLGVQNQAPTTTAYDIASFFEKLYNGDLANKEYTEDMINLLKQQKLNEKLPAYLPDNITLAHKTGELDSFSHDGGIVFSPNGDYIIVILTDSDSPDLANERIANISQAVFTYFSQNQQQDTTQ